MNNQTMPMLGSMDQDKMREYLDMQRNQRLAKALTEQGAGDITYDPRGVISPWQGAAKIAAALGGAYMQNKADQGQMEAAQIHQQQLKDAFAPPAGIPAGALSANGVNPQALGEALAPQKNSLSSSFDSPEQAMFLYQNNPELYKEIVGKNLLLTENQKNYGGQLGALNDATIAEKQGQAAKSQWMDMSAGNTATNIVNGQQIGANRIIENDLNNVKQTLSVNPLTGKAQVLRTDTKGMTPAQQIDPNMVGVPDNEAAAMALTIFSGGKEAKQILSGNRANNPKVQQFLAQLSGGIETTQSLAEKHKLNMNTGLITNDQDQYSTKNLVNQLGSTKSPVIPFNASISHMAAIEPLIDALGSGNIKAINAMENYIKSQLGDTAVPSFEAAKKVVSDEITKAIVGGQMAQGDRQAIEETLASANTPAQLKAVVNVYKELMAGKLGAIEQVYKAAGKDPAEFRAKYLEPESRAVINRIRPIQPDQQQSQSQDAKDAADWIAKNPNDPKVPRIKAHYDI